MAKRKKQISLLIVGVLISIGVSIAILTGVANKNFESGNLNTAIWQYKIASKFPATKGIKEKLALAQYEKDAIEKVNVFYHEMERVKEEIKESFGNYEIIEVTKSAFKAFQDFDNLEIKNHSELADYVQTMRENPQYQLYKLDYLTGQAVITDTVGDLYNGFLGEITKENLTYIINDIIAIPRPDKCLYIAQTKGALPLADKIIKAKAWLLKGVGVFVLALFIWGIQFFYNPVGKFMNLMGQHKYSEAILFYNKKIKGKHKREEAVYLQLKKQVKIILSGYKNKIISYEKAVLELENIRKVNLLEELLSETLKEIQGLELSKLTYEYPTIWDQAHKIAGEDMLNKHKIAIIQYTDKMISEENHEEALRLINEALLLVPDDEILELRKMNYEKAYKEYRTTYTKEVRYQKMLEEKERRDLQIKMKETEEKQDVTIISIIQYTDSIGTNLIAVKVRNNTKDKIVKGYEIKFKGFDAKGKRVKVGLAGGEDLGTGKASDQHILPGQIAHSGGGWYIDNQNAVTFLACISRVIYEGEVWGNPYYYMWLDMHKESL